MPESLYIWALGSGSSGNSIVISNGSSSIMVDAGFSCREIKSRMACLAPEPAPLAATLITHDHTDHVRGCRVFCNELDIPAAVSLRTADYLRPKNLLPHKCFYFEPGSCFDIADYHIRTFPVPHDAMEPVGFVIESCGFSVGIATDLGEITCDSLEHLRNCDALILESNYDPELLRNCDRPLRIKRRIAGRQGHLENRAMCQALPQLLSEKTRFLMLFHLSSECNLPELAERMARETLESMGRNDITLALALQNMPTAPCKLEKIL